MEQGPEDAIEEAEVQVHFEDEQDALPPIPQDSESGEPPSRPPRKYLPLRLRWGLKKKKARPSLPVIEEKDMEEVSLTSDKDQDL
mgnify:FL=1